MILFKSSSLSCCLVAGFLFNLHVCSSNAQLFNATFDFSKYLLSYLTNSTPVYFVIWDGIEDSGTNSSLVEDTEEQARWGRQPIMAPALQRKRRELLTINEKELIVSEHNKYRSKEGANAMEYMVWNDDMGTLSEGWAKVCTFEHGQVPQTNLKKQYETVGQNLYATKGNFDMAVAIQAFYKEKSDYDFDTNTCAEDKMCGHYTQVVWDSSKEVGCAWITCPNIGRINYANSKLLVCDYYPSGNIEQTRPYSKGPACSQCANGKGWCYNGLCRADCTSSIGLSGCECAIKRCKNGGTLDRKNCRCRCSADWMGNHCEEKCADKDQFCNTNPGYSPRRCTDPQYREMMRNSCPLMCGVCGKNSTEDGDMPVEFNTRNGDAKFHRTTVKTISAASTLIHSTVTQTLIIILQLILFLKVPTFSADMFY